MATTTSELMAIRSAMAKAVKAGAGEDWDHPAAAGARALTAAEGMTWDFTSWPDALRAVESAIEGGKRLFSVEVTSNLDALRTALIDDARRAAAAEADGQAYTALDWTRLPTFGGEEPRDTAGVWSWDATRLLVGTSAADLRIVAREE